MEKDIRDIKEDILQDALKVAVDETEKRYFYQRAFYISLIVIVILGGALCLF